MNSKHTIRYSNFAPESQSHGNQRTSMQGYENLCCTIYYDVYENITKWKSVFNSVFK